MGGSHIPVGHQFSPKVGKIKVKVCTYILTLVGLVLRAYAYGAGQLHRHLSPMWKGWAYEITELETAW